MGKGADTDMLMAMEGARARNMGLDPIRGHINLRIRTLLGEWARIRIEMGGYLFLYGALYAVRRRALCSQVYQSSSA